MTNFKTINCNGKELNLIVNILHWYLKDDVIELKLNVEARELYTRLKRINVICKVLE